MIDLDLKGKRAVITGASLGIGAASVKMLADQGAEVSFCARNQETVNELIGYKPEGKQGSVKGFIADMGEAKSTNKFIEENCPLFPIKIVKSFSHSEDILMGILYMFC